MIITDFIFTQFKTLSKKMSRRNLYEWLETEVKKVQFNTEDNATILNIGSGGALYNTIKDNGLSPTQIDIDADRNPDIVADICDLNMIDDNSIDAIFMMEVLEHVKTPDLAIKELLRTLKPDAPLVLSTPFIFPIHDAPHDYYRYTRYGLAHLLQDFNEVVIRERNDYISSLYVICARSIMADNRKNRWVGVLLFAYMLLNYPVLWVLSKFYKNPQGTTGYFVTARKPK